MGDSIVAQPVYQRIRSHIVSKRIPFRTVAEKARIDEGRFYRLMDGTTTMHADEIEKICSVEALELNPAALLCSSILRN